MNDKITIGKRGIYFWKGKNENMTFTQEAREFYHKVKKSQHIDPSTRGTMWSHNTDLTDIIETSKSDSETIERIQNTTKAEQGEKK
jgi:hypothetical protein